MISDPRAYAYSKLRNERHINACRWKNLVYARTLKCGSEFFYKNFTITAGWTPIQWQDIEWNNDIVFSYIMDPIIRRNKGVSEYLLSIGAEDLILNNAIFGQAISQTPCFDEHSACLRDLYGNHLNDIQWILMDNNNHALSVDITDQLLEQHSHLPIKWQYHYTHTTANYLDKVYNKVVDLWNTDPVIQQIALFYFKEDIELYTKVKNAHAVRNSL